MSAYATGALIAMHILRPISLPAPIPIRSGLQAHPRPVRHLHSRGASSRRSERFPVSAKASTGSSGAGKREQTRRQSGAESANHEATAATPVQNAAPLSAGKVVPLQSPSRGTAKGGAKAQRTAGKAPTSPSPQSGVTHSETSAAEASAAAVSRGSSSLAAPVQKPPVAEEDEASTHSAAAVCADRAHWLHFTVPETPQAGHSAAIYFNKSVSEALRWQPRVNAHVMFNGWELPGAASWPELQPVDISSEDGSHWWRLLVDVPLDSYEMNYVFSDGEGLVDNNSGDNYITSVSGGMSAARWLREAPQRANAAERVRKAAELRAAVEAGAARQAFQDQSDREAAAAHVDGARKQLVLLQDGALGQLQCDSGTAWLTEPEVVVAGRPVRLLYNSAVGPLHWLHMEDGQVPTLRFGYNGWAHGSQDVQMVALDAPAAPGELWWVADVSVPRDTVVLDFVVFFFEHFDNNDGANHRARVTYDSQIAGSWDGWWDHLESTVYGELQEARHLAEAAAAEKAQQHSDQRAAAREKVNAVRRRQMRHVLFTEPAVLECGSQVELYYNPRGTVLADREAVWVRGGFNRWRHAHSFGPLLMTPPGEGGDHFQAKFDIPADVYKVDLVFSDVESGEGSYDNQGGFDYHLPVAGSDVTEPALHVMHVSVEMAPICKVGGLGDVVTALGRAVQESGNLVEVILPRYDFFLASPLLGATQYETEFAFGGTHVFVSTCVVEGLRCFFIEPQNGFFATETVYGRKDDGMRFAFFCKAALEFLLQTGRQPDILHCHDWSTAPVARAYWENFHSYGLWNPKVVFTIHNLDFGQREIGEAAYFCQRFTTVSPTYATEVAGDPAVSSQLSKFMGVRNGIDVDIWDPASDPSLPRRFGAEDLVGGKAACREALRQRLGLTGWGDRPMVGVVSRLTAQKGIQLIKHCAWRTLERGGQFVLLGSAPDPKVQAEFNALAGALGGENAAFAFAYDEPLSHLIYAACDIICVPSIFEPCGLTQMIAMRYGSVPVVRSTGGLRDTVFDVDFDKGRAAWEMEGSSDWERDGVDQTNGFAFEGTDEGSLDFALNRALDAWYNDRAWFHSLAKRCMLQDWSWNRPALDYIELYWRASCR